MQKIFEAQVAKRAHPYKLPPDDFDPLRATDRVLAEYGLPPRPLERDEPDAYAFWHLLMSKPLHFTLPKFKLIWAQQFRADTPETAVGLDQRKSPVFSGRGNIEQSRNWSGLYLQSRPSDRFVSINGAWRVPAPDIPTVQPTGPDPSTPFADHYRSSVWVGLDGHRSYPHVSMPQAGTRQNIGTVNGKTVVDIAAWWQWWSATSLTPEVEIVNMPVAIGHQMLVELRVISPDEVIFVMKNQSTGVFVNFLVQAPADSEPLGKTAEWIVERPTWPGSLWPHRMPKLTDVDFSHCLARTAANPYSASTVERLDRARRVRMYEIFDAPHRSAIVSVPEKTGPTGARIRYREAGT